jgi:tungstate transport system substrate-binding protein
MVSWTPPGCVRGSSRPSPKQARYHEEDTFVPKALATHDGRFGHSLDRAAAGRKAVILATTTSTQDSGLLDRLLPLFEERTGYRVKTIAVGTGEALAMGRRGDADVLLAHAPAREKELVEAGFAVNRQLVMHNDFLIAGPDRDPAGIHGGSNGAESIAKIAGAGARFASRGDNSGTHFREMSLWQAAGLEPAGDGYISTGQGMGATLFVAAEKGAYLLTDRATYLATRERTGLVPHVEGDPLFLNIYSVMEVNPNRFPRVNQAGARAFSEFLRGPEAQEIIREFGVERFGQPLFFPDAGKTEESLAD